MAISGKTAIVTGAAQGIGYAIAERFVEEEANVLIADINVDAAEQAANRLGGLDKNVAFVKCNVADKLSVKRAVNTALSQFGAIDILVNNAGIVFGSDFLDLSEEDFDKVLSVNLKGAFLMGQAVAKKMARAIEEEDYTPGTIINMSSINAVFATGTQIPYAVSKGGLNQLTRAMAMALAPKGIRVNAIGPGSINTEMLQAVNTDPDARNRMLARTPMGRIGDPSEIASIAVFLASDDASYITGQTLYADGGRLGLHYTVPVAD